MIVTKCDVCGRELQNDEVKKVDLFDINHLCKEHYDEYMALLWEVRNKLKGVKTQDDKIVEAIDAKFHLDKAEQEEEEEKHIILQQIDDEDHQQYLEEKNRGEQ